MTDPVEKPEVIRNAEAYIKRRTQWEVGLSLLYGTFIMAIILTMKVGDASHFFTIFVKYLPESFFISIISHHFFKLLDYFWKIDKSGQGVSI